MAFMGIQVPPEAAHLLSKIQVPGEKSDPAELHITLMYFGDQWSVSEISKCLPVIQEVAGKTQPFIVSTALVTHFPGHREGTCAVIAKVESTELHRMRGTLAQKLDQANIEYSKQFKEYKPHITLSYAEEEPKQDKKMHAIQFKVEEITLWGGQEMHDKIIVNFPLGQTHKHAGLMREIEIFEKLAGL
jgi:2'-5' RNA ligase